MIYVTVPGDTVSSISRQSGVPVWKIIYDNQLGEEGELTVGQALLLLKPQESAEIREDLYVTGYAYPFIEPYVLEMAFPALNELLVFSYGFTFEGELVPPIQSSRKASASSIVSATGSSKSCDCFFRNVSRHSSSYSFMLRYLPFFSSHADISSRSSCAVSTIYAAFASFKTSLLRNPQETPIVRIPAACPVLISTSESPI